MVKCWAPTIFLVILFIMANMLMGEPVFANPIPLGCFPLEGKVKVTVYDGGTLFFHEWTPSALSLVGTRDLREHPMKQPHPHKISGGNPNKWNNDKTGVDQSFLGPEIRLDAPYDISPDGGWLISAVFSAHNHTMTNRMAVIHRKEQSQRHIIELPYYLEALSWSPSGQAFVILYTDDVTKSTPRFFKDWLSDFIGHPISYRTVRAAIYYRNGDQLCEQLFMEKASSGGGYVDWVSE